MPKSKKPMFKPGDFICSSISLDENIMYGIIISCCINVKLEYSVLWLDAAAAENVWPNEGSVAISDFAFLEQEFVKIA